MNCAVLPGSVPRKTVRGRIACNSPSMLSITLFGCIVGTTTLRSADPNPDNSFKQTQPGVSASFRVRIAIAASFVGSEIVVVSADPQNIRNNVE
jgi:hypothetical protein